MGDGAKKAIGYVRVSTDEQEISVRAQQVELNTWCDKQGIELLAIYVDSGVSGAADLERCEGLLQAIDATEGADLLLVTKRDRLGRDVIKSAMVERLVQRNRAAVMATDGMGNGSTAEQELFRVMLDAFAQYERRIIGRRIRKALAQLKREGVMLGGEALGWQRIGERDEDGRLVVVSIEGETRSLERVKALRSNGLTYKQVAELMNKELWPTKRGGRWHASTVHKIIKREKRETRQSAAHSDDGRAA